MYWKWSNGCFFFFNKKKCKNNISLSLYPSLHEEEFLIRFVKKEMIDEQFISTSNIFEFSGRLMVKETKIKFGRGIRPCVYIFWEMIFTLLVHNNYTHTKYIGVEHSVWAPFQCALCECSCIFLYEEKAKL
jgi:hypothetical protein